MAALPWIAAIAGMAGSFVSAQGTIAAGKAQQQALNDEAEQLEVQGKQRQAAAQVEAGEYKRNKDLALSKLQSNAAASGFSATDPTTLALADEISRYGTFQQQMAQYGGATERAGLDAQARGRRITGQAIRTGSRYEAAGTILGGISSMAGKFSPATRSVTTKSNFGYG